ncbi:MAG TPA: ABC transporter permease [Cyclobacteriaceae bacterium]|nr:ABC transporter permease [Cyclobacteriaceae bacterium]
MNPLPKWWHCFLRIICPPPLFEEIEGDLVEKFHYDLNKHGYKTARRKLIWNVFRFLRTGIILRNKFQPSFNRNLMIRSYLIVAWRNILKSKAHSFINVFGLSIGLAVAILIMLYTSDDLSFDKFHSNVTNIYRITGNVITEGSNDVYKGTRTSTFEGPQYTNSIPEIESYIRINDGWYDIRVDKDIISQRILSADSNFFSFFSFPLLRGDPRTALVNHNSIVLTENTALKLFGDEEALGRTLLIVNNGELQLFTVTGVASNAPENSSIQFQAIIPLTIDKIDLSTSPIEAINGTVNTFITVDPKARVADLLKKMQREHDVLSADAKKAIHAQGYKLSFEVGLQAFTDIHLAEKRDYEGAGVERVGNVQASYMLIGIAVFILVIACVNFINLTIAKSSKRAKEIGVRRVIGSKRSQLVSQFLGESFLLCAFAFLIALVIAQLFLPVFNELVSKQLSIRYLFDAKLVFGFIALFFITASISGFYPAIVMSSYQPIVVLAQRFRLRDTYFQKGLVVFQFALATLLTTATFTVYQQYNYLTNKDLGYDPNNVLAVGKPNLTFREIGMFRNELSTNPDIETVSVGGGGGSDRRINGDGNIHVNCDYVDANYIPMFRIRIVQGRNFSPDFATDSTKAIIVNETFVEEAGWKDPIGQVVEDWPFDGTNKQVVVGVLKDWNNTPLTQAVSPEILMPQPGYFKDGYSALMIRITPGSESRSLKAIESAFRKIFPLNAFDYVFQTDNNKYYYESEARWKRIVFFSSIMTVMISCIGLLGLTMITAEKRSKELSIRKVLGATVKNIVMLLSGSFLRLVIVALLIATPMAWYLANVWLELYPYRFEIGPLMFVEVAIIVIAMSLITTVLHSLRAALSNPVDSLKSE